MWLLSAADVKIEITVLVPSLRSIILSSTSFKMDETFWKVVSAADKEAIKMKIKGPVNSRNVDFYFYGNLFFLFKNILIILVSSLPSY